MTPAALLAALALVPGPWATWATQAQVPTYPGAVSLSVGGTLAQDANGLTAVYPGDPPEIQIQIAGGLDAELSRGTLYHELGHAFDAAELTDADRATFMTIWGLPGGPARWWYTHRDARGAIYSPGEWFAESYRMAATWGIYQAAARVNTWEGYDFPGDRPEHAAQQRASATLIDAVGQRNGIPTPTQRLYRFPGRVIHATIKTNYHHPKESQ